MDPKDFWDLKISGIYVLMLMEGTQLEGIGRWS